MCVVHESLEDFLRDFLGMARATVYSYEFTGIVSIIQSLVLPGDYVLYEDKCQPAIERALIMSKSRPRSFKRGVEGLNAGLVGCRKTMKRRRSVRERLFVVCEAVSVYDGTVADMMEYVRLKYEFGARLIVVDTLGMGAIGKCGKGSLFLQEGFEPRDVDVYIGSFENAFGSVGSFVAGSVCITSQQILNGKGFIFSASSPPFLCIAAQRALERFGTDQGQILVDTLRERTTLMYDLLDDCASISVMSERGAPFVRWTLVACEKMFERAKEKQMHDDYGEQGAAVAVEETMFLIAAELRAVVDRMLKKYRVSAVVDVRLPKLPKESVVCPPSIRLCPRSCHSVAHVQEAALAAVASAVAVSANL